MCCKMYFDFLMSPSLAAAAWRRRNICDSHKTAGPGQEVVTQKEFLSGTGCLALMTQKYLQLLKTGFKSLAQHSYIRVTRVSFS